MTTEGETVATIEVELCGKLAGLHGALATVAIPRDGGTAAALLARVAQHYPDLAHLIASGRVRVCVNETLISTDGSIAPGDRVALFPPVSGG